MSQAPDDLKRTRYTRMMANINALFRTKKNTTLQNGFLLVTPVWGKLYTEIFLSVGLPSLLAQHNLPAIKSPLAYHIYTTSEDAERLQENFF
jgi:hypothetical protein